MRFHVPQKVEAVRLDLGEGLFVGDDVPVLVLLRLQDADDSSADPLGPFVVEGLLVDVEGIIVLLQLTGLDPGVQFLPCGMVPLVRILLERQVRHVVGVRLELFEIIVADDVVGRRDAVHFVLPVAEVRSVSGEWKECNHRCTSILDVVLIFVH